MQKHCAPPCKSLQHQLKRHRNMKVIAMNNVPVKLWVDQLDAHAWEEVNNLTTLPFLFHHLALMPDAHGGKGMPIGGVLAYRLRYVCRENKSSC